MKNPKVETRSRDSNLGPYDCKADALPQDHGQGKGENAITSIFSFLRQCFQKLSLRVVSDMLKKKCCLQGKFWLPALSPFLLSSIAQSVQCKT